MLLNGKGIEIFKEILRIMDRKKWEYENILKEHKLENRFDNFLRYLLAMLKRKYG